MKEGTDMDGLRSHQSFAVAVTGWRLQSEDKASKLRLMQLPLQKRTAKESWMVSDAVGGLRRFHHRLCSMLRMRPSVSSSLCLTARMASWMMYSVWVGSCEYKVSDVPWR